jgi:hypothetical protein
VRSLAVTLLSLFTLPTLFAQGAPALEVLPPLDGAAVWRRAERMSEAAAVLKPSYMKTLSCEYSKEGRLTSAESSEARLLYGEDGEVSRMEVISAVKNGKDVSSERQKDFDRQSANSRKETKKKDEAMNGEAFLNPFVKDESATLTVSAWRRAPGGDRLEADFSRAWKNGISQYGTVCFDAQGGLPLYMDYSIKVKVPGLSSSSMHVDYMPAESIPDCFVVKSMRSEFLFDLLAIKKRVTFSLEYSQYRATR